jgi:type I restriction enzyme S subunit
MTMVEWKKLGDICTNIIVPMRDRPKSFDGNIPWCRIEDIEGMYFNRSLSGLMVSEDTIKKMNLKVFPTGTVICSCSATLGVCAINTNPLITNQTFIGLVCSSKISNRFLYYYMLTRKRELYSLSTTGTIPYVSREKFEKMLIPIPSRSEQERIVGILDTFTAAIENLKKQIEERRKQYYYLIDSFFGGTFQNMMKMAAERTIIVEPLSKHGTFTRGRRFVRTDIVEAGMPCIHYGDMYTTYGLYADKTITHLPTDFPKRMRYAHKGDVVIVGAGENNEDIGVGLVWQGEEPAAVHDACYIYEHDFEPLYLSYFLRSGIYHLQIKSHVVRGKICSISSDGIGKALIPVYDKQKQKEIVDSLLPFESLIANLEQQLAMRQKQYEYYRNKLLTFE